MKEIERKLTVILKRFEKHALIPLLGNLLFVFLLLYALYVYSGSRVFRYHPFAFAGNTDGPLYYFRSYIEYSNVFSEGSSRLFVYELMPFRTLVNELKYGNFEYFLQLNLTKIMLSILLNSIFILRLKNSKKVIYFSIFFYILAEGIVYIFSIRYFFNIDNVIYYLIGLGISIAAGKAIKKS